MLEWMKRIHEYDNLDGAMDVLKSQPDFSSCKGLPSDPNSKIAFFIPKIIVEADSTSIMQKIDTSRTKLCSNNYCNYCRLKLNYCQILRSIFNNFGKVEILMCRR